MTTPIPGPAGLPLIGNLLDIQGDVPIQMLERLADIYGPIFKLRLPGSEGIFVAGFDLFDELCDETRFFKFVQSALKSEGGKPNGLFGSPSEKDEDWGVAHRVLMPAFGPLAIEGMFDGQQQPAPVRLQPAAWNRGG